MTIVELILIALGLSMDAFAVSVCKGLSMKKINYHHATVIAIFFGSFQALMPLIGWLIGSRFAQYISDYDHWVAFLLLAFIGGKMIVGSFKKEEENIKKSCTLDLKELFILAVATSIDALAIGITFALLPDINIGFSIGLIGVITLLISFAGVCLGNRFGSKYKNKAELAGGIILVILGLKILIEHLLA